MLSDNIRKYRKENNLSQDELADKLNISRQSVSLWENGQTQPTVDNIIALSEIFHITADELLKGERAEAAVQITEPAPVNAPTKKKRVLLPVIIIALILIAGAAVLYLIFGREDEKRRAPDETAGRISEIDGTTEPEETDGRTEEPTVTEEQTEPEETTAETEEQTTVMTEPEVTTTEAETTAKPAETTAKKKKVDLFDCCKKFVLNKGRVNGDYVTYMKESSYYGGYEGEYFDISYWNDSDRVEFCLHCPLSDTFSINFYITMRGGFNGKYEYSTSRYYRDTGESLRAAYGYIDPAVFSPNYPLSCDRYIGSVNGQNEFMEESRVGIVDLINLIKQFAKKEKLECGFKAFGFVNF